MMLAAAQNRSYSKTAIFVQLLEKFSAFMKAECSLPYLQEPTSGPYLDSVEFSPNHLNVFLPSASESANWSLFYGFPNRNACTLLLAHTTDTQCKSQEHFLLSITN
jgi:hypothetical protein